MRRHQIIGRGRVREFLRANHRRIILLSAAKPRYTIWMEASMENQGGSCTEKVKKKCHKLRELAGATRGNEDTGSRNLVPNFAIPEHCFAAGDGSNLGTH